MFPSDQIFEAIISRIDHNSGTCSISPIDANSDSTINDVPIPHFAGNGNFGIFCGINVGTRVLALFTSVRGREVTVISGLIPKNNLYSNFFLRRKPTDTPSGTIPYPNVKEGDLYLRGDRGAEISLLGTGDISIKGVNGGGTYIKKIDGRTSMLNTSSDIIQYSSAGRVVSGPVRRMSGAIRNLYPSPDISEIPLFADPDYAKNAKSKGFFLSEIPMKRSYRSRKRNPEISEYRMVINEFSSDSMFTGFDDEAQRVDGSIGMYDNSETFRRNREQGNTLHLAEHELIEVIGGNLVDINGNVLDINYRPLSYSDGNRVPRSDIDINYDRARRISRRGVGYHFQLSTNTKSSDLSESKSNFVFDLDKEGLLKINIPSSSDTGNIPFVSNANYIGNQDNVEVSYLNSSVIEQIPVTLRDETGQAVFPGKGSQGYTYRKTGIRYAVDGESPYFPTDTDGVVNEVRVNSTKHHNMYATAERLIANTIRLVNIPERFASPDGFPEGMAVSRPFEVPIPSSLGVNEGKELSSFFENGGSDFPSYMSVIAVEPGNPAVYPGGGEDGNGIGTLVAGRLYTDEELNPPYSNAFSSRVNGDEVAADINAGDEEARPVGGRSIHANIEGSVETSVGKDNYDQKSITLDTEGSVVAWMGKDRNGRSFIGQTDGDFLLNLGGSYEGQDTEQPVMNKGRFELRVNVTDKGFTATQYNREDDSNQNLNPGSESDFIISISENGIVIAGMKKAAPMIFRNDGPILIESSSSDVTLKGVQVKIVDPKGAMSVIKPPTRNS